MLKPEAFRCSNPQLLGYQTHIQIETEFKTATGRVDAVVRTGDTLYVMEFKYGKGAAEALAQIDEKDYCLPFESDGRHLIKIGVNFSPEERTIDDWIIVPAV